MAFIAARFCVRLKRYLGVRTLLWALVLLAFEYFSVVSFSDFICCFC